MFLHKRTQCSHLNNQPESISSTQHRPTCKIALMCGLYSFFLKSSQPCHFYKCVFLYSTSALFLVPDLMNQPIIAAIRVADATFHLRRSERGSSSFPRGSYGPKHLSTTMAPRQWILPFTLVLLALKIQIAFTSPVDQLWQHILTDKMASLPSPYPLNGVPSLEGGR